MTDDTLQPIVAARGELSAHCRIAMAPQRAHEICSNKSETFDLAESLGIDVPERLVVDSMEQGAKHGFAYPVVVKPNQSVVDNGTGERRALSVRYAQNPQELTTLLSENLKYGPVILQEYAGGVGVGIEVLVDHGEVVAAFQHRRLHEWPLTGGGSSYRESMALDDSMLASARALMKSMSYHGVAMVEFKFDVQADKRWLMEINGRFWGSLALCVHAGANFPAWLFDLDVDKKRPRDTTYQVGIRSRRFSRDLFWAIEVLRKTDPNPLIHWPPRYQGVTTWLGMFHPRHRFDVQNWRDRAPGWFDFKNSLTLLLARIRERKQKQKMLQEMRDLRGDESALRERLRGVKSVLFLCYGNINRSALAAVDLEQRLPKGATLTIESTGFHDHVGRPADKNMLMTAKGVGLDLTECRSTRIDQAMVDRADLILAMDVTHLLKLHKDFPEALTKTLLHATFDSGNDVDIEICDPYGAAPEIFENCLKRVVAANSGLLGLLEETTPG